jgi:hypothetical protein
VRWFNEHRPDLTAGINPPGRQGVKGRHMLSILNERKLRRVLARLLDPNEFLSNYGIRALSRYHLEHPYVFRVGSSEYSAGYLPAESDNGLFGGNSNWRGPIWVPMNALLIRALLQMYSYYGNEFKVECPTGSGKLMTLFDVAKELAGRLGRIFFRGTDGKRAVYGGTEKFQTDPHWRDLILFYEYFHGDNGAGLGASHQTGWTGLVSAFIYIFSKLKAADVLEHGLAGLIDVIPRPAAAPEEAAGTSGKKPGELPEMPRTATRPSRRTHAEHILPRRKARTEDVHGDGD